MPITERNGRIDSTQIHHIRGSKVVIKNQAVAANDTTTDVTTTIVAALWTLGRTGAWVQNIVSAGMYKEGVMVKANDDYEIAVVTNVGKNAIGADGEEVYARLAEAAGAYTLEYYTLDDAGVEAPYTFAAAEAIDFCFGYRFKFEDMPDNVQTFGLSLNDDPAGAAPIQRDVLTVSAINTLSALTKTPLDLTNVIVYVNGVANYQPHLHFTVVGTAVTRDPAEAWYNLLPGYDIMVEYTAY